MTQRWDDDEVELKAAERLAFFSDAVVAIAITLLALELPVPAGSTVPELLHSVQKGTGEYVAFLISFGVIAAHWFNHHRVFRYVRRADQGTRLLNTGWLFLIVILPFVTRLLNSGESGENPPTERLLGLLFAVYALVQVLAYGILLIMVRRLAAGDMLRDDTPSDMVSIATWRFGILGAAFAISIQFFFVITWAWAIWIFFPTVTGYTHRIIAARRLTSRA